MASAFRRRLGEIDDLLAADKIDIDRVIGFSFSYGVPEGSGRRAIVWKLLLNYLPPIKSEWEEVLKRSRKTYRNFIEEIIINPHEQANDDHPLNPNPDSQWNAFFKDNVVLVQIDKDVRRLYPDMSFFQQPTAYPLPNLAEGEESLTNRVERNSLAAKQVSMSRGGIRNVSSSGPLSPDVEPYQALARGEEAHWQVVERILFIYAKLNPGIGYVQGMNEVIGPLYYVFANTPAEWQEHAEADTFFCFTTLMSEIKDNFIKTLDYSACGIGAMMNRQMKLLQSVDPAVHRVLEKQSLSPQFFSFRWLTLLLSQEFQLPDVIRLWDSLLADTDRFDFLIFVCCAMLVVLREKLLSGDFAQNMKLLQNYPEDIDIHVILQKAMDIRDQHSSAALPLA